MYFIILSPLFYFVPLMFGRDAPAYLIGTGARVALALAFVCLWYSFTTRRAVRRNLAGSGLAGRIAQNDLPAEELRDAMPWPWSRLIRDDPRLEPTLLRVAGNLDWYVSNQRRRLRGLAPSRLFRPAWIYLLLALVATGATLVPLVDLFILRLSGPYGMSYNLLTSLFFGLLSPLFPLPFFYYRRQVWTQELLRYLREQLASDESESAKGVPVG
jgi:hypothetical protein